MKKTNKKSAKLKPIVVEHPDQIEDALEGLDDEDKHEDSENLDETEEERQEREYMEKHGIKRKNLIDDEED